MSKLKPILKVLSVGAAVVGSCVAGTIARTKIKGKLQEETPEIIVSRVRDALDNAKIGIHPSKKDEENMQWVMSVYEESKNASFMVYLNKLDDMGLDEDEIESLAKECSEYFISKKGDSL